MVMLRQWNGDSNDLIIEMAARFGVVVKPDSFHLFKYEELSPDSFIWFFIAGKGPAMTSYCLYAEDYVPALEHVQDMISENKPVLDRFEYEFLPVVQQQAWEESSPVISASVYSGPSDRAKFMKFAATSGYDFVFLCQGVSP